MDDPYIEMRDGGYYVRGSRVSLDSIVYDWLNGRKPEEIQEDFPTLRLAEVYGAIAYYLDHQAEIDHYLKEQKARYEAQRTAAQAADPEWYARMRQRMAEARARLEAEASSQPTVS
jgi:uncharacterized protein (DUF433 family)